ncbi:MAG: toll/interleukin-1 receptor domain-containing protein [bacterium]|nr:toll/interleukin-1 receptor domain-containing protein [bacterium]
MSEKLKVFISHIHEEKTFALELQKVLEDDFVGQISAFVSSSIKSVQLGKRWREEIRNALNECKVLYVICSPHSVYRPWINIELGFAWCMDNIDIVPVCIGMDVKDLPDVFSEFQGIAFNDEFVDQFTDDLVSKLQLPKKPRLDTKKIIDELRVSVLSFQYENGSKVIVKNQENDPEIDEQELSLLRLLSTYPDNAESLPSIEEIYYRFENVSQQSIKLSIDRLCWDLKLIKHESFSYKISRIDSKYRWYYTLSHDGRKYLKKRGLL